MATPTPTPAPVDVGVALRTLQVVGLLLPVTAVLLQLLTRVYEPGAEDRPTIESFTFFAAALAFFFLISAGVNISGSLRDAVTSEGLSAAFNSLTLALVLILLASAGLVYDYYRTEPPESPASTEQQTLSEVVEEGDDSNTQASRSDSRDDNDGREQES